MMNINITIDYEMYSARKFEVVHMVYCTLYI